MFKLIVLLVVVLISCVSFATEIAARKTEQTLVEFSKKDCSSKLNLQANKTEIKVSIEETFEDENHLFGPADFNKIHTFNFEQKQQFAQLNTSVFSWESFKTTSYLYEICVLRL